MHCDGYKCGHRLLHNVLPARRLAQLPRTHFEPLACWRAILYRFLTVHCRAYSTTDGRK